MSDHRKTKAQLIAELESLRWQLATRQGADATASPSSASSSHTVQHATLLFSQSIVGAFFMRLDEPVRWDETVDKEQVLDYVFTHQRMTDANDALLAQYQMTREQLIGITPQQLFAHDAEYGRALWRRMLDHGHLYSESSEQKVDGTQLWVEGDYLCLYDATGRVTGHFGVQRDMTAQKQAEFALRKSEERFHTFMNNAPVAAYIKDEQGRYVYINKRGADLVGLAPEHWYGKTDAELWTPEIARQLRVHDEAALAANATVESVEHVPHADGNHHWLSFKFPLPEEEGQRLLAGVSIDMTEHRRTEAWLQGLIETTQDAVISIDRQGHIAIFNSAAERIFGYSRAEIQGQPLQRLMPEPYAGEHDGYVQRYEQTHEARAIGRIRTVSAKRKNGNVFPIELSVTEVRVENQVHYAAFIRDISERVQLQERLLERERLAMVGATAAKLVHEIGNPLNSMSIALQLLQRRLGQSAGEEHVRSSFQSLTGQMTRLANLLQEFRSLSRRHEPKLQPLDLRTLVEDVLAAEAPIHAEREIVVEHHSAPNLAIIHGDPDKLRQVLLNLCKNAVEAMPGGGTLTVCARNSGNQVFLEVADTGVGIPYGVNILEPFVTTKAEGTGLGLPIVRQIVSAHGGTLDYTSSPGQGTTFIVALPQEHTDTSAR
jgi:PAS domain S-box-containing protein